MGRRWRRWPNRRYDLSSPISGMTFFRAEAAEQRGFALGGGRGGKDPAQGERRRDGRGPDTAPGHRVERTHRRAPSGATEQECTVHCAAASNHHRSPEEELTFA